jgi:hypothetical protein
MLCFLIGTLEERLAVKNAAKASLRERAVEEYDIQYPPSINKNNTDSYNILPV